MLPLEVRIHGAAPTTPTFDPRDNCGKEYWYRLSVSVCADPLLDGAHGQRWHLPPRRNAPQWDAQAAARTARLLLGSHSYAAFANTPRGSERVAAAEAAAAGKPVDTTCCLSMVQLRQLANDEYMFRLRGDRFLYKMVRNIVGALVKVGHGELSHDEVAEALEQGFFSRSKSLALTAPPQGLVLRRVLFGGHSSSPQPNFQGMSRQPPSGLRPWRARTVVQRR